MEQTQLYTVCLIKDTDIEPIQTREPKTRHYCRKFLRQVTLKGLSHEIDFENVDEK